VITRETWRRLRVFSVVAVLVLPGCADASGVGAGPDIFFPTWSREGQPEPVAGTSGRLVVQNGCLFLEHASEGGTFSLPLWPDSWNLEGTDPISVVADDGSSLLVGETVSLGGGAWPAEAVEELIGESVPERCEPSSDYWLATEVIPGD
jgi:hypothetical protein